MLALRQQVARLKAMAVRNVKDKAMSAQVRADFLLRACNLLTLALMYQEWCSTQLLHACRIDCLLCVCVPEAGCNVNHKKTTTPDASDEQC